MYIFLRGYVQPEIWYGQEDVVYLQGAHARRHPVFSQCTLCIAKLRRYSFFVFSSLAIDATRNRYIDCGSISITTLVTHLAPLWDMR
jgi:hypothetical protein